MCEEAELDEEGRSRARHGRGQVGRTDHQGRNDAQTINATRDFTGTTRLTLKELDHGIFGGGQDDNLGHVNVDEDLAGLGSQKGDFHLLTGADYHITYKVEV